MKPETAAVSREIRFRAWDGEAMHYPSDGEYLALFSGPKQVPWRIYDRHGTMIVDSQYEGVLMQSTGLKDAHGQEIYEGDIVVARNRFPVSIEWSKMEWMFRLHNGGEWMNKFPERFYRSLNSYDSLKDCMVIGNIHETPALLQADPDTYFPFQP